MSRPWDAGASELATLVKTAVNGTEVSRRESVLRKVFARVLRPGPSAFVLVPLL